MGSQRFVVRVLTVVFLQLAGCVAVVIGSPSSSQAAPEPVALRDRTWFQTLSPARLLDTRPGYETVDGAGRPGLPLDGGTTLRLPVLGRGGIPSSGVSAVVLNVTATGVTQPTYLTVWPSGADRPLASNLNVVAGQTVANLVVAKLGDVDRQVAIFNAAGRADVVVDVAGYVPSTDGFVPLVPARLLETRPGLETVDGRERLGRAVGPGESVELPVSGRAGVPEDGVDAVVLNVTAIEPTADSYVTVWPTGAERPVASNLNLARGVTGPNLVVAKVGDRGSVSLFNATGATHLIADVAGWFPTGGTFVSLPPSRVLETRPGLPVGPGGTLHGGGLGQGGQLDLPMLGAGGVPPSGVSAVVLNVTAIAPSGPTYLTVWPAGMPRPVASNVNVSRAGQVVPNLVLARLGSGGAVSIYNQSGRVDLVVDVAGYVRSEPSATRTLAADDLSTCVVSDLGEPTCWGSGARNTPHLLPPMPSVPYRLGTFDDVDELALSGHGCARRRDGTVWCWGSNIFGQSGGGTTGLDSVFPPVRALGLDDVVDIDASFTQTCAVRRSGRVACWGGDHFAVAVPTPTEVPGIDDAVEVDVADSSTCVRHRTGEVSCWGKFVSQAALGGAVLTDSTVPVRVVGVSDAVSLASGDRQRCVVRATGRAACWGSGVVGTSGVPMPLVDRSTGQPAEGVEQIVAGADWVCALRVDRQVWCLGTRFSGQVGLAPSATTETSEITTPVPGLPPVARLLGSRFHACALTVAGDVYCWGRNHNGQLGDGTTQGSATPRRVPI